MPLKASSMPGAVHARTILRCSVSCAMRSTNVWCTASNMTLSCGSCLRMSSEPTKMFSRYCQLRCTCCTISMASLTSDSVCSQCVMSFSNTTKNLLAFIVDSVTVLSSSAANASSVERSLYVCLYSTCKLVRA